MNTFLYFAYGSNMSERRLTVQKRAPSAKVIGPAVLKNYCLTFHKCSSDGSGKCTIEKSESDKVYGVVFKIKLKDECQLDKEEGARGNGGYKKVTFKIEMCDATGSKYKDVKTYIANKDYINCTLKPYTWYKQHVLVGAIENKLPSSYIDYLMGIEAKQYCDKEKEKCELGIYDKGQEFRQIVKDVENIR